VAYGARLESVLGASPRGFESPSLRQTYLKHRTMTNTAEQTDFLSIVAEVGQRATTLFGRYFRTERAIEIDYLSLYTKQTKDFVRLCATAAGLGEVVAHKNGPVYQLDEAAAAELPTDIVRVREPSESGLIGCADFVTRNYWSMRQQVIDEPACIETAKDAGDLRYAILELADPDLKVAIYLPSERMTQTVMGL
jgi:hypothetical protein